MKSIPILNKDIHANTEINGPTDFSSPGKTIDSTVAQELRLSPKLGTEAGNAVKPKLVKEKLE